MTPELVEQGHARASRSSARPATASPARATASSSSAASRAPPSYDIPRLRSAPAQHFFDVITNGYGVMYSYADRVSPHDRWAIVAYIRALQLSQHATVAEAPEAKDLLK